MQRFLIFIIIFGLTASLLAEGNGGYAGAYLRLGLGARAISMGNAQTATPEHPLGFFYNPAGVPFLEKRAAAFSYNFMSLDRRFLFAGFSTPLKPHAGVSVGWIYSGVGDLRSYDSRGVDT
ncbi:MAG: hypothetical protein WAN36_01165, partial [Calditrichia bacterium]